MARLSKKVKKPRVKNEYVERQKGVMGPPTKYREDYPQIVEQYLKTVGDGTCKMPKRCDVARMFRVCEDTLKNWEKEYDLFGTVMRELDLMQKGQMMDDGVYGGKEVNHQMTKFILSANHGMAETEKHEHTGANGSLLFPDLNALIKKIYGSPK